MKELINRRTFFDGYRTAFGPLNQSQVDGLSFLIDRFESDNRWSFDARKIAYALATIKRECADTWQPIEERGSKVYLSKYYLKPSLRKALGNIKPSDAWVYKGRGYVQITGRTNYAKYGLLDTPERALDPTVAFRIMTEGMHEGRFTGKSLRDYIGVRTDYFHARRIINGLDHAGYIAADAVRFEEILRVASS